MFTSCWGDDPIWLIYLPESSKGAKCVPPKNHQKTPKTRLGGWNLIPSHGLAVEVMKCNQIHPPTNGLVGLMGYSNGLVGLMGYSEDESSSPTWPYSMGSRAKARSPYIHISQVLGSFLPNEPSEGVPGSRFQCWQAYLETLGTNKDKEKMSDAGSQTEGQAEGQTEGQPANKLPVKETTWFSWWFFQVLIFGNIRLVPYWGSW